jgi:hypothetical protein
LRRIASETEAPSVKVRDTAERDTPALSATSFNVTANLFTLIYYRICDNLSWILEQNIPQYD